MAFKFTSSTFTAPSNGKEIFFLSAGPSHGPLIIFLHGWPGIALTWQYQLRALADLGFYVVAPDMPAYGQTWTSDEPSDFALEKIVPQCLDLLAHVGRKEAIWVGHDWGCGPLWAIASHHPEVCTAIIAMSVPYRTLEHGLICLLTLIDRELYPEDTYPHGPWDYQVYYERHPKATDEQFEPQIPTIVKLLFARGNEEVGRALARTTDVNKNRGWFGGVDAKLPELTLQQTTLDENLFKELVDALGKTGFHGATSWYLNHAANEKYAVKASDDKAKLKMPVLFIHTEYDAVCQTVHNPLFTQPMREYTEDLSEFVIKAAHWGMLEKPEETNAGVVEWILKKVPHAWPGPKSQAESASGKL